MKENFLVFLKNASALCFRKTGSFLFSLPPKTSQLSAETGAFSLHQNFLVITKFSQNFFLPPAFLPVRSFSGGMKTASLARALLVPSDLLILDEPFTGLDEASRLQTMSFLLKYRNERTLFFSTHRKDDADFLHASLIQL